MNIRTSTPYSNMTIAQLACKNAIVHSSVAGACMDTTAGMRAGSESRISRRDRSGRGGRGSKRKQTEAKSKQGKRRLRVLV